MSDDYGLPVFLTLIGLPLITLGILAHSDGVTILAIVIGAAVISTGITHAWDVHRERRDASTPNLDRPEWIIDRYRQQP
jgi:hypothetical protein